MKRTPARNANTTANVCGAKVTVENGINGSRCGGKDCRSYTASRQRSVKMKSNLRRLSCKVSAQTLYNLGKLARICGYGDNIGKVIDKLTREKMLGLRGERDE